MTSDRGGAATGAAIPRIGGTSLAVAAPGTGAVAAPVGGTKVGRFRRDPKPLWNGFGQVPRWIVASGKWASVSGAAKGILVCLAYRLGRQGAYPSIRTLMRENGTCRETTLRGLRELRAAGLIIACGRRPKVRTVTYEIPTTPPASLIQVEDRGGKPVPIQEKIGAENPSRCPEDQGGKPVLTSGRKTRPDVKKIRAAFPPPNERRKTERPKGNENAASAASAPRRLSPASGSGRRKDQQPNPAAPPPPGFEAWLAHLNEGLGHPPPQGYTPTSYTGRRLAVQFARVMAEGRWTEADLSKAIDSAMGKLARGFEAAGWPSWILANVEELVLEARPRPGNGRAEGSAPVFRRGADYDAMIAGMRDAVER